VVDEATQTGDCCVPHNGICTSETDVCCTSGYICSDDLCPLLEAFSPDAFVCCGPQGALCNADCECCGGLDCINNECQEPV
jgi:hypothetical protein